METKVAPIINKYCVEDAFPFELLPAFKELKILKRILRDRFWPDQKRAVS
jgi:hypothetical protein